jgi:hypothetical protein
MPDSESGDATERPGITEHSNAPGDVSAFRKQLRLLVAVGLLALAILLAMSGSYALLVVFGVLLVVFGLVVVRAFSLSRPRDGSSGLYWKGLVSFNEEAFPITAGGEAFRDESKFPDILRIEKRSVGRQGLTGGHLRLKRDGIHWKAGSILTPGGQLHGEFFLPWSAVRSVDVSDIPYKSESLGAALRIYFPGSDDDLYGELLGSRKGLLHGLRMSPLGRVS